MSQTDEKVLIYAGLFTCCAFISAIVGPWVGLAAFLPAAAVMEAAYHWLIPPNNHHILEH